LTLAAADPQQLRELLERTLGDAAAELAARPQRLAESFGAAPHGLGARIGGLLTGIGHRLCRRGDLLRHPSHGLSAGFRSLSGGLLPSLGNISLTWRHGLLRILCCVPRPRMVNVCGSPPFRTALSLRARHLVASLHRRIRPKIPSPSAPSSAARSAAG